METVFRRHRRMGRRSLQKKLHFTCLRVKFHRIFTIPHFAMMTVVTWYDPIIFFIFDHLYCLFVDAHCCLWYIIIRKTFAMKVAQDDSAKVEVGANSPCVPLSLEEGGSSFSYSPQRTTLTCWSKQCTLAVISYLIVVATFSGLYWALHSIGKIGYILGYIFLSVAPAIPILYWIDKEHGSYFSRCSVAEGKYSPPCHYMP